MTNHEIAVEAKKLEAEALMLGDKKLAFRLAKLAQKAIRADLPPSFSAHETTIDGRRDGATAEVRNNRHANS
jgi:hypothetical protein